MLDGGASARTIKSMEQANWFGLVPFLAFTDGDRWKPGIGDPTFMGWLTVVAYLAAAGLCWRASRNFFKGSKLRWFWLGLSFLLLALGINKQLDLQTELTFLGKDFAKATGWYEHRRIVQALFILFVALGGAGLTAFLAWRFRNQWKRVWQPMIGLAFLMSFIVIRAASFHHVDQFLKSGPGSVRMNWILELGGIIAIGIPAWRTGRRGTDTGFVWVSHGGERGPGLR